MVTGAALVILYTKGVIPVHWVSRGRVDDDEGGEARFSFGIGWLALENLFGNKQESLFCFDGEKVCSRWATFRPCCTAWFARKKTHTGQERVV